MKRLWVLLVVSVAMLAVPASAEPSNEEGFDSDFARTMASRYKQLRSDEALRSAVARHGRILSEPVNATAPAEAILPAG